MKTLKILVLFILTTNLSFGQVSINQVFIDKIEYGYTTRWDIEKLLGKGVYLTNKIIEPNNEQDLGKQGYGSSNGLAYLKAGLIFVCSEDGELISGIRFQKQYKGLLDFNNSIEVGKTKLGKLFPELKSLKVSTTEASNYWLFTKGKYIFYIKKSKEDKKDYYFSSYQKNSFKDNLDYYNNQPISIATINIENKNNYFEGYEIIKKDLHYIKPMYKPKNENHLNCFRYGWPDNLPSLLIPFYAMTGGSKSKKIKEGYWKEYSPRHTILYEGTFKNNKKIGLFKYYDINGKLKSSVKY